MKPTIVQRYEFDPGDVLDALFDVVPDHTEVEIQFKDGYLIVDFTGTIYAEDAEPNPADQADDDEEEKSSNLPADERDDTSDEQSTTATPENAQAKPVGRKAQEAIDFLEERLLKQFFEGGDHDDLSTALVDAINGKLHVNLQIFGLEDLDRRKDAFAAFHDVRGEFLAWRDE